MINRQKIKLERGATRRIALSVLLIGMLTFAFSIQPVSTFGAGSLKINVPDGHVYWNNGDFITTAFTPSQTITANFVTMNCLDDNNNDGGSETFEVAITTDSEGNNVIASAQITNNFRNTGGCDAHKYSFDFGDVPLTGGTTYYLRTKVLAGAEVRAWLGATLYYDGGLPSYNSVAVPVPDGYVYWNDGDFITTPFSFPDSPDSGRARFVTMRCLDDNMNDGGSETFEVAITTDSEGSNVIANAQITNNFRNTGGCDEHMYLFDFFDVSLMGDSIYYLRTKVLAGAEVRTWNWTSNRNRLYYSEYYDVTIEAYCYTCDAKGAPVSVSITMDGSPTGEVTPYTFTGLIGTHTFTIPNSCPNEHSFKQWHTGETSTTITVSSAGTYIATYQTFPIPTLTQWGLIVLVVLIVFSAWVVLRRRRKATVSV